MFYNQLLEKCILPLADIVRNTSFIKWLNYWRAIQNLTETELAALQSKKLQRILKHVTLNIPRYAILKNKTELNLKDFPIIHKLEIKHQIDRFMWHPNQKHKLVCERSSGSSGIQGTIYMSKEEQSKVIALQTLLWEWTGYKLGTPMLQTGMSPNRSAIKRLKDITFNIQYEAAFDLQDEAILKVLSALNNKNTVILGGYASSLYVYAQVAEKFNLRVQFKSVISWGDKLFDHYRQKIETVFTCNVFDIYGTTEGFVVSGQYDLPYQYIITPQSYVELLDKEGNEVADGEIGHVVITHLDNYEMPLIRYYLGDLAIKLPIAKYPKNKKLNFPLFQKIIGRDTDIVITPKGNKMIVHFFTAIIEHIPQIKQFRVVQKNKEGITIEYIPDDECEFDERVLFNIKDKIHAALNEQIEIQFTQVASIPNSPSGKPQLIVSTITN